MRIESESSDASDCAAVVLAQRALIVSSTRTARRGICAAKTRTRHGVRRCDEIWGDVGEMWGRCGGDVG